jgi:NitT/TauT family transport system permease protein
LLGNGGDAMPEPAMTVSSDTIEPSRADWLDKIKSRQRGMPHWLRLFLVRTLIAVVSVGAWQVLSSKMGTIWISSPALIAVRIWQLHVNGSLYVHAGVTVLQAFTGLAVGAVVGIAIGMLLGTLPRLAEAIDPFFMGLYSLPRIALAPLFIIWFGFGFFSKIVMVFSLVFVVFILNTMNGLREVDRDLIALMRTMCATRLFIFRKVQLPSLVPWVFAALRISIGLALIGSVLGELLGANRGLGWYIEQSGSRLDTTGVFAGLFVLMIVAVVINEIVKLLEAWALGAGRAARS